ncbi:MAG: bifunctional L-myo-inositol-1-phosphate cytidylyltransferase/CDP-L-myo-inositol myo-inositolphosphotransferase [Gammaproteobacteria bacterium]|nr:MAG: bifunctional L-myo-inositol-1-phosphate cytidylyltransferase/CDP-L-myo-inositol myo-inositolphosphotransferase [Gammaproteobacteria bacterium]
MKCLIIAAGKGSRLQQRGDSKPLVPLLGIPLIERVIRAAMEAGAEEFFVVIGYQGERVRNFLERLADRLAIRITPLVNDDWDQENGLSVLKAREVLHQPFLLLMADHLFDPKLIQPLTSLNLGDGELALVVDGNTRNPLVDLEDVTRVKVESKKIRDIGKGLDDFNGFDTGIFLCSPAIFKALEQSKEKDGDTTLSGAVRVLAAEGRAKAALMDDGFWIDVDDPAAFQKAEQALLTRLRDKPNDGPVARYLNRPLSVRMSRYLVQRNITPNQISLFSFLCSVLAAGLFMFGGYSALLLGGILAQFASIIDGCDGEVARLKYQSSDVGGWFDAVLDRYADAFLLFGLTWHLLAVEANGWILLVGFMAIIGSFMLSYTADKYDKLMRERLQAGGKAGLRMGRDVRVFLIFLGAVTNLVLPVLVLIAVVMNIETLRRVKMALDGQH